MPPRVTVIIPTYNWSSVLPYSIGGALRQTFTDFELLVVGDGCTDDSEAVVAAIADGRVRWINLPANSGHQSGPNNEGLRQARGEIIAYLGHDDLWLPHHLARLVGALDADRADVAYAIMAVVGPDAAWIRPTSRLPRFGHWPPPSCIAHRRTVTDALRGWRDHRDLTVAPEADLMGRAHAAGFRFAFVPRLTGIKFPAAERAGVYKTRPCHEQAEWLARIEGEPDFENELLGRLVVETDRAAALPYRELLHDLVRETMVRVRRRLARRWFRLGAPGGIIAAARRFKGL